MTQVKTISIKDEYLFDQLNQITPDGTGFSKQITMAVESYVTANDIDNKTVSMPAYDAPMDDWKDYIKQHPEKVGDIIRRHVQLGNVLKKETYAIR